MRITNVIRDYVTEEIRRKYENKIDEISKTTDPEKDLVVTHLLEILDKANKEASEYLAEKGYTSVRYGSTNVPCFTMTSSIRHPVYDDEIEKTRSRLNDECRQKTKQILFNLAMGETAKAELKELLDNIVIE